MFPIAIRRVQSPQQVRDYQNTFYCLSGVIFPTLYLLCSRAYLLYYKGKPVGGFVIADISMSRAIGQIPKTSKGYEALNYIAKFRYVSELNGYFITNKKLGFFLVTFWMLQIFLSGSEYFVYAYESSNNHLKKYYSYAKPILLYDGIVNNLDGMFGVNSERVELMSRLGFLRLYFRRIKERFKHGASAKKRAVRN